MVSNQASKSRTNHLWPLSNSFMVVQLVYGSVMISWNKLMLHIECNVVLLFSLSDIFTLLSVGCSAM